MEPPSLERVLFIVYPSWVGGRDGYGVWPTPIAERGDVLSLEATVGPLDGSDQFFDREFSDDDRPGLWLWEGELGSPGEPGVNPLDFSNGDYRDPTVEDVVDLLGPFPAAGSSQGSLGRLFVARHQQPETPPLIVGWDCRHASFPFLGNGHDLSSVVYFPQPVEVPTGLWLFEGQLAEARCETGDDEAAVSELGEEEFFALLDGRHLRLRKPSMADLEWLIDDAGGCFSRLME